MASTAANIIHQTSSDRTGGRKVMQFDTASQNKHEENNNDKE